MKTLKGLLLGSAGAAVLLAASSVAQAADAPQVAAKGKEPVYRCDTPGFIEYPGSDVCFKIGGYVAAYYMFSEDNFAPGTFVPWAQNDDGHTPADTTQFGTNANLNIDVRQATEYGIVRVFIEFASYDDDNNDGGPANLRHGFIQVGNWLAGKTWSTFFAGGWPEYMGIGRHFVPLGVPLQRNNQIRYTASLGNGVTASIALEDPGRISNYANSTPVAVGVWDSRNEFPDIVGNIRATGSWGSFQVSFAAHEYSFCTGGACTFPGPGPGFPGQEWAWAVNGVLVLNVPSMGKDTFHLSVGYSDGHASVFTTNGATHLTIATGPGAVALTETFVVVAGYRHFWSADLRSTLGVSYVEHDYPDVTPGDVDEVLMVWGNLIWSPVPNLDVGLEVMYGQVGYVGPLDDDDGMAATAQVSRSF